MRNDKAKAKGLDSPCSEAINEGEKEAPGGILTTVVFKQTPNGNTATSVFTVKRQDGLVDLVSIVHQAVPDSEKEAVRQIADQAATLSEAFSQNSIPLHLKDVQRGFTQDEISELAIGVMRSSQGWRERRKKPSDESVLVETALLWRLLKQFGSSKPAEVLAKFFGAKPKTINARLLAARDLKLIPAAERNRKAHGVNKSDEKDT
jgi:hypothetical protein